MGKKANQIAEKEFPLIISEEVEDLLLFTPGLSPAAVLNQAIDELAVSVSADYLRGVGNKLPRRFRLTPARIARIEQFAASTGMSKNEVVIAAIRQFARNHPPYPRP